MKHIQQVSGAKLWLSMDHKHGELCIWSDDLDGLCEALTPRLELVRNTIMRFDTFSWEERDINQQEIKFHPFLPMEE